MKKVCPHPLTKSMEQSFTLITVLFDGVKHSLSKTVLIIFYVPGLV